MTQSRILQQHIEQLHEIRGILHSLKNMAVMEMHRLEQYRRTHNQVVQHIVTVADDFLNFFPGPARTATDCPLVLIVIGSERGFCGDFNEKLIKNLEPMFPASLIAVGHRLCNRLNNDGIACTPLAGANGSEEISQVMNNLIATINKQQEQLEVFRLSVLSHCDEHGKTELRPLLPPFTDKQPERRYRTEPLLNLPPPRFLLELVDHYVFSVLQDLLFTSLATENNQRLQHLDNAVRHLDEETAKLRRISQIHRQEEIIEEIEVILLNAENQGPNTQ